MTHSNRTEHVRPVGTGAAGAGQPEGRSEPIQLAIRQMVSPTQMEGHTHLVHWEDSPDNVRVAARSRGRRSAVTTSLGAASPISSTDRRQSPGSMSPSTSLAR